MKRVYFFFLLLLVGCARGGSAISAELKVGDQAPDFSTVDELGLPVSLKDYLGQTVILYFYPKDDTPGCTIEAKSFRDDFKAFEGKKAVILGVSYDKASSHKEFKEKYKIPFRLLVDSDKKIAASYGAQGIIFASRDTFIIDPKGKIIKIYRGVNPNTHVQEVLKDLP